MNSRGLKYNVEFFIKVSKTILTEPKLENAKPVQSEAWNI